MDSGSCSVCGHRNPPAQSPTEGSGTWTEAPGRPDDVTVLRPAVPALPPPTWVPHPAPAPQGPPEPPRGGRPAWLMPVLSSVLVLVLAGGGYAVWSSGQTAAPAPSPGPTVPVTAPSAGGPRTPASTVPRGATPNVNSPTGSATPSVPTSSAPTAPADPRVAAYERLEALVRQDAGLNVVRGQWVAQLASKYEGIVDPLVRTQAYTVAEILAEHEALRANPDFGASVRLLHQGDWGRTKPHDPPMWVTVADINAPSAAVVRAWCESRFPVRGKALENVCYARQLTPKGS